LDSKAMPLLCCPGCPANRPCTINKSVPCQRPVPSHTPRHSQYRAPQLKKCEPPLCDKTTTPIPQLAAHLHESAQESYHENPEPSDLQRNSQCPPTSLVRKTSTLPSSRPPPVEKTCRAWSTTARSFSPRSKSRTFPPLLLTYYAPC
jgi:hypothetical protein